jgi:hypothetical protein
VVIPKKDSLDAQACMRVLRAKDFKVDSAIDLLTRQMVGFV